MSDDEEEANLAEEMAEFVTSTFVHNELIEHPPEAPEDPRAASRLRRRSLTFRKRAEMEIFFENDSFRIETKKSPSTSTMAWRTPFLVSIVGFRADITWVSFRRMSKDRTCRSHNENQYSLRKTEPHFPGFAYSATLSDLIGTSLSDYSIRCRNIVVDEQEKWAVSNVAGKAPE